MIYVLCPADVKTGGTELLHQLVKTLTDVKVPAGIVYTEISEEHPGMNPAFLEYTDGYLREEEIEDEKGNILVVPEIYCERTARYQNLSVYIWWLSVDNYLIHNSFVDRRRANGTLRAIKALLTGKLKDKTDFVKKAKMHLCQSYYAIHYLETIGISGKQVRYLSDYVNDIYLAGEDAALREKKEDVVLYNPKKGAAFTKALREMAQDLRWVPLIGMTTEKMRSCMSKSKVYIDFGNHPGKDRIPREAAISGCIVITGKRGAAAFAEDVCIPETYKFDESCAKKEDIISCIRDCICNFDVHKVDFDGYRSYIRNEHQQFTADVKKIFVNEDYI